MSKHSENISDLLKNLSDEAFGKFNFVSLFHFRLPIIYHINPNIF